MSLHDQGAVESPTIVLLHSLGTNRSLWRHQEEALAATYRVCAPEAPGHGTRPWTGETTLDSFLADLDEQLAELSGPLHLVGISMGGHLAVGYAAAHPDRVASIVVANSFVRMSGTLGDDRVSGIASDIAERGMNNYATRYLDQTLTRQLEATDLSALHDAISGMTAEAYLAAAAMTFRGDLTGLCAQVSCPTLVIAGSSDHKVPRERTAELVDAIPGAELIVLNDAGHLSCIEQPQAFTSTLTTFLDRATASTVEGARA